MRPEQPPSKRNVSPSRYDPFNVRAKTRQVVDHHYDEEKEGKPLYLIIPGGVIALISLALIVWLAYSVWIQGTLVQTTGLTLMALLAPFYIGGVFLFSYGYELYDLGKALRLTSIVVFFTFASVIILAVLAVLVFGLAEGEGGGSSGRSRSGSGSPTARSGGGMGWGGGFFPIFMGGLGMPGQTVTREVIREKPVGPPPPQSVQCPYCGNTYVPAETHYTCPACGAPTPKESMPPDFSGDAPPAP